MTTHQALVHPAALRDLIPPGHKSPPQCRLCGRRCNRYANVARPVCGQCSTLRQHALPPKLKAAIEKCHYCPVFTANGSRVCTRCLGEFGEREKGRGA